MIRHCTICIPSFLFEHLLLEFVSLKESICLSHLIHFQYFMQGYRQKMLMKIVRTKQFDELEIYKHCTKAKIHLLSLTLHPILRNWGYQPLQGENWSDIIGWHQLQTTSILQEDQDSFLIFLTSSCHLQLVQVHLRLNFCKGLCFLNLLQSHLECRTILLFDQFLLQWNQLGKFC